MNGMPLGQTRPCKSHIGLFTIIIKLAEGDIERLVKLNEHGANQRTFSYRFKPWCERAPDGCSSYYS